MAAGTGESTRKYVSTREAAFIGVGAMVGAGIFSLLGSAGEIAGAAVWLSFLLAGGIAALQGYSFSKLGAKFPTAGGLLEYINQGYGMGHIATVAAWLVYAVNAIVTAMVAVSFGSYASSAVGNGDNLLVTKLFAVGIVVVMTLLNIAGSSLVARVQSIIVFIVVGILTIFSIVTIANIDTSLLAPANYPPAQNIISSVALTFFAFLGFGIVTFTAKDSEESVETAAAGDCDRDRHRDRYLRCRRNRRFRHPHGAARSSKPDQRQSQLPLSRRWATLASGSSR